MPVLRFEHEDPEIGPFEVECDEWRRDAVVDANTGNGWSLADDGEPADPVQESVQPSAEVPPEGVSGDSTSLDLPHEE